MKSLSNNYSSQSQAYSTLEIGTEVVFSDQYSLPRHISRLEIKSHRSISNLRLHNAPKTCQVNSEQLKSSLALDILKYQLSDRTLQAKHWENIHANLERRLIKARKHGNAELISILQAEYQQL